MRSIRVFIAAIGLALVALPLSACGLNSESSSVQSLYEAKKHEIPRMVKKFSSPNLGVLLNSVKIAKVNLEVVDSETLGTMRLADRQGAEMLGMGTYDPPQCRQKLLQTYQDNASIPAAFSQGVSKDKKTIVRIQLRSFDSTQLASQASEAQQDLAKSCPKYSLTLAGANGGMRGSANTEVTHFTVDSQPYRLDGATNGVMNTFVARDPGKAPSENENTVLSGPGSGYTMVGVFQRIGNLELRVYFDGVHPQEDARKAKTEIQNLVTKLGQALVAKAK